MYIEKHNKIDTKAETKDYEKRYRMYGTVNPTSPNIINLDIFYKHNPIDNRSIMNLSMFNRFYKPFNDIDWSNIRDIEWLQDQKYDIDFLKDRGDHDYHYRYYIDKGTYNIILELQKKGFVPVVWKLSRYIDDIIHLEKQDQTEEVKQKLSKCKSKIQMLYLAFTPLYAHENTLRHEGLAQISKYIMLHDIVYAVKKTGFTDLKQICKFLRERQDTNKTREATNRNTLVIDHHNQMETSYTSNFYAKMYPSTNIDNVRFLYNHINLVWYIENADMPSANNLMNNLYEIDNEINSKVKNKIIDRNKYMFSYITDYKMQIVTVFLRNTFIVPFSNSGTNVIEIAFPLSDNVGESASKNIESLYEELREAEIRQEKTEAEVLYGYAQKNKLDFRYRDSSRYDPDTYFLLWLNRVPLFTTAEDVENARVIKYIKK